MNLFTLYYNFIDKCATKYYINSIVVKYKNINDCDLTDINKNKIFQHHNLLLNIGESKMSTNDKMKNDRRWPNTFQANLYEAVNNINGLMDVTDILIGSMTQFNKYPPRNIKQYKFDDRIEHIIEFALAGFKKSEIKVVRNGKFIEVSGSKIAEQDENPTSRNMTKVLENGISFKNFNHRFELNTLVDSASDYQISSKFEDGLLTIKIVKRITPKQTPTEINIE